MQFDYVLTLAYNIKIVRKYLMYFSFGMFASTISVVISRILTRRMGPSLLRNAYLLTTSVVFCSMGLFLLLAGPKLLDYILSSNLILKPDSYLLHMWRKNPIPLRLDFYLFNWTNPEEIHNSSTKPKFQEIGPYVFRETKEKVNITFHANNTVTFRQLRHWYFDERHTKGSLEDIFVTVNPILVVNAKYVSFANLFNQLGF